MQLKSNFKNFFGKTKLPSLGNNLTKPKVKKLKITKPKSNSLFSKKRKTKFF